MNKRRQDHRTIYASKRRQHQDRIHFDEIGLYSRSPQFLETSKLSRTICRKSIYATGKMLEWRANAWVNHAPSVSCGRCAPRRTTHVAPRGLPTLRDFSFLRLAHQHEHRTGLRVASRRVSKRQLSVLMRNLSKLHDLENFFSLHVFRRTLQQCEIHQAWATALRNRSAISDRSEGRDRGS